MGSFLYGDKPVAQDAYHPPPCISPNGLHGGGPHVYLGLPQLQHSNEVGVVRRSVSFLPEYMGDGWELISLGKSVVLDIPMFSLSTDDRPVGPSVSMYIIIKQAAMTCLSKHEIKKGHPEFNEIFSATYRGAAFALVRAYHIYHSGEDSNPLLMFKSGTSYVSKQ